MRRLHHTRVCTSVERWWIFGAAQRESAQRIVLVFQLSRIAGEADAWFPHGRVGFDSWNE